MAALPAARIGDDHICPLSDGPKPHVGGPVQAPGARMVFIEGKLAARVGDVCQCKGPPDAIAKGSASVFINGKPASRQTDATVHGGRITGGASKTFIGDGKGKGKNKGCMAAAAANGNAMVIY